MKKSAKINQLKNRKMKKFSYRLVLGLFFLGVLSTVSCDIESTTDRINLAPFLGRVSFSASASGQTRRNVMVDSKGKLTFNEGDQIKLYIEDSSGNPAKYYTYTDQYQGIAFPLGGKTFTFKEDKGKVFIDRGFYLEGTDDPGKSYTITKFDITKKNETKVSYVLKNDTGFKVIKDIENIVAVTVVENGKGISVEGEPKHGLSTVGLDVSVSQEAQHQFELTLQKSNGESFNSTKDSDCNISLTVKDPDKDYEESIDDLFNMVKSGSQVFTITLGFEKDYYSDNLTIEGTVTKNGLKHDFTIISGSLKSKSVALKVNNSAPIINYIIGADGVNKYGTNNNTFDVNQRKQVSIIEEKGLSDPEKDIINYSCTWSLLYNNTLDRSFNKSPNSSKKGKIRPAFLENQHGIKLNTLKTDEVEKYSLKVNVKLDDGLGGTVEQEFDFKLTKS